MRTLHALLPSGVEDPARPSGGNAYDRRVLHGLAQRGWRVVRHELPGDWPNASRHDLAQARQVLAAVPEGSTVLVDGLVGSALGDQLSVADGSRLVLLVHLPLGVLGPQHLASAEVLAVAGATRVVTTSDWTAQWLVENADAEPTRVDVAVPGTDPAPLTEPQEPGGRLLTVGAVTPVKGQDRVVAALASATDLRWTWTCVGALDVHPAFAASVRTAAADVGVADRVRWTGALTPGAVAEQLAEADLLLVGSRVETWGMVVGEALARGLPVLVPPVGGLPLALGATRDGRRPGLVAERDDADALAAALRDWLTRPGLRAGLRDAAVARRAEGLPSWAATTDAVEACLAMAWRAR